MALKAIVRKHNTHSMTTTSDDCPVPSTGWSGIRDTKYKVELHQYTGIAELKDSFGMRLFDWNRCTSHPLVDKEHWVIGVLGGHPNNDAYLRATEEAANEIKNELKFRPNQQGGRRDAFSSVSIEVSFGGGQQVPGNLAHPPATIDVFQRLFSLVYFLRMAGFANRA
ncbi:hypothetical protein MVEN_02199000 [Mycena venus]|uniref:Uncharacterized protein n=1 Tax=Mycena venus TaxID=2733690 RepID=A0A8H7CGU4_9AGAR|nr:hypothetical protein MVEN_02199000 [Mycena venus]